MPWPRFPSPAMRALHAGGALARLARMLLLAVAEVLQVAADGMHAHRSTAGAASARSLPLVHALADGAHFAGDLQVQRVVTRLRRDSSSALPLMNVFSASSCPTIWSSSDVRPSARLFRWRMRCTSSPPTCSMTPGSCSLVNDADISDRGPRRRPPARNPAEFPQEPQQHVAADARCLARGRQPGRRSRLWPARRRRWADGSRPWSPARSCPARLPFFQLADCLGKSLPERLELLELWLRGARASRRRFSSCIEARRTGPGPQSTGAPASRYSTCCRAAVLTRLVFDRR